VGTASSAATVLDVVEDYFRLRSDADPRTIPGKALYELGDEIRSFAASYSLPAPPAGQRVYIGGWPSASFWAVHGDMILTSLLYSGQVLIKDPLSDWFSEEQYLNRHKQGARPGYRTSEFTPNVVETRSFLAKVLPALIALKPLVDAGLVALLPSERYTYTEHARIAALEDALGGVILPDVMAYTQKYSPMDVPVEDNQRGLFVFAGGERDKQLTEAARAGLRYFAREYALATANEATYVAPFPHEQFLTGHGLAQVVRPAGNVAHALLQSELPIFSGLTPSLLVKMHCDDNFSAFRHDLHTVYSGAPVGQGQQAMHEYVVDQEASLLTPRVVAAQRSIETGPLRHLGATIAEAKVGIAMGLLVDLTAGTRGAATVTGAAKTVVDHLVNVRRKKGEGARPLWTALVRHGRTVQHELRHVQAHAGENVGRSQFWGIPERASMSVTVSTGQLLWDWLPEKGGAIAEQAGGYYRDDYKLCDCGSGRKFRFCCKSIQISPPH
jgi:hypothetical protein